MYPLAIFLIGIWLFSLACPAGIPMVQCDGNPCDGATCPSHPTATCTPNYCGSCKPQWSIDNNQVQCHGKLSCKTVIILLFFSLNQPILQCIVQSHWTAQVNKSYKCMLSNFIP